MSDKKDADNGIILVNKTPDGEPYEREFPIDQARKIMTMARNGGWQIKPGQSIDLGIEEKTDDESTEAQSVDSIKPAGKKSTTNGTKKAGRKGNIKKSSK